MSSGAGGHLHQRQNGRLISKTSSLHTIALTRETKLLEDTRDCQGKRRVKCRIQHRPPPGEVGGAKLYRNFSELR